MPPSSPNDALLLIGHGSLRHPDAGSAMHRHANRLRKANRFAQVEAAQLNGSPSVPDALARIQAATIRVVPFFMEDGYFNRTAVPRALGLGQPVEARGAPPAGAQALATTERAARAGPATSPRIVLCSPVGVHDGMAGLIERHALAACNGSGIASRSAALLVVGHGSSTAPGQALALHRHTSRVAATQLFARVETACLEEAPFVAEALRGLRTHPTLVIGFFANQGGHVRDDVPALIAAERAARACIDLGAAGFAVRFDGSIVDDPAMIQIIKDQARDSVVNDSAGD